MTVFWYKLKRKMWDVFLLAVLVISILSYIAGVLFMLFELTGGF